MHDYIKGAYEALSWVRVLIKEEEGRCRLPPNHPPIQEGINKLSRDVEGALEDISKGVATDFRRRLRALTC